MITSIRRRHLGLPTNDGFGRDSPLPTSYRILVELKAAHTGSRHGSAVVFFKLRRRHGTEVVVAVAAGVHPVHVHGS